MGDLGRISRRSLASETDTDTDRQRDRHRPMASTTDAYNRAVKNQAKIQQTLQIIVLLLSAESVDNHTIIAFIRQTQFYHQL